MKNIWKLLMVAMMAIAMVGCPQPQSETTTTTNGGSDTGIEAAVYTFTDDVANISSAWGGSTERSAFSIMLMDQIAIDSIKGGTVTDLKEMPVGSPVYQIQGFGDGRFITTAGTWNVYGKDTGDNYAGLCAKIANGKYTLYVDTSKMQKTQLKGIGKDFGQAGEKVIEASDEVDLAGFVPVTLALSDTTSDEKGYIGDLWGGRLVKMTKSDDTYPTNAQDIADRIPKTINDINYIIGDMNDWKDNGTANLVNGKYTLDVTADSKAYNFQFIVAGNGWGFQIGGAAIELGTKAELSGKNNITITLAKGTYTIAYSVENSKAYVLVTAAAAGDDSSSAAGAGDTSSSAAGAGDNGSSAAGAGDNGSSAAGAGEIDNAKIKYGVIEAQDLTDDGKKITDDVSNDGIKGFTYSGLVDYIKGILWVAITPDHTTDAYFKTVEYLDASGDTLVVDYAAYNPIAKNPKVGFASFYANVGNNTTGRLCTFADCLEDVTHDVAAIRVTFTDAAPTYSGTFTVKSGNWSGNPAGLKKSVDFTGKTKIYSKVIQKP